MRTESARSGTTLCALSSPADPAERAIVRLSGPESATVLARCVTCDGRPVELTRRTVVAGRFDDGRGEQPVEIWWMPGPASYTREDVAELHLIGAPPLVDAVVARLLALGCEPAGPGEFTRRAFENGRLDLTQAEGVLELVSARNEDERRAGLLLFEGGLSERTDALRGQLEELRALCEASLDFDEADTGHVPTDELARRTAAALAAVAEATLWEDRRAPVAREPRIALLGAPNAGKSTLFNALTSAAALVDERAGTTRDEVRGRWTIDGLDVLLIDAPGVEDERDAVERKAHEIARRTRASVELVVVVVDAAGEQDVQALLRELESLPQTPRVLAWSKTDLIDVDAVAPDTLARAIDARAAVSVSATSGVGFVELGDAVRVALGLAGSGSCSAAPTQVSAGVALRHRRALEAARTELERAADSLGAGAPLDLVAESLRAANDELDAISGRTATEDLLDRIFAQFCIGK